MGAVALRSVNDINNEILQALLNSKDQISLIPIIFYSFLIKKIEPSVFCRQLFL
jgi:hypothetical protein